ncbi:MAG: phytanoyl-CoA dioxygenase family protein [Bacteroidetes bacterium]|nr:phytanoyl-CoA dioxygenase family protein [Bacteroidota bacterium]
MFEFKPKDINPIFKDSLLQNELEVNGFIIVPFYNSVDIKLLTEFYDENTQKNVSGFQPTTYFNSLEYRLKASSFIKNVAKKYIDQYFTDYKTYMGSFIVKYPDKNSELGVHQDMTLVDESQFMGANIWAPLCDTNEKNGALYLIPKSHRILPTYRNATIKNIYDQYYAQIKKYMQPVYLKAGEAIVFDNSILHFSPANLSKEIRIATNVFTTHKEATITICYHDKQKNLIEMFEQEDDFFTTYTQFGNDSNQERPKMGKSIGFTDYNFPDLTPTLLEEKYGKLKNENWLSKIKDKFFA